MQGIDKAAVPVGHTASHAVRQLLATIGKLSLVTFRVLSWSALPYEKVSDHGASGQASCRVQ